MRLLRAELQRAAARRLVRVSAFFIGVAIVVGGVVAFVSTSSLSESEFEQRVRTVTAQQRAQQAEIEGCLAQQPSTPAASAQPGRGPKGCFPSHPIERARDPRFHASRLRDIRQGAGGALGLVGWILGASLIGAEFSSRGLTTLLTFEPRRQRAFLAKASASIVIAGAIGLAALLFLALVLLPALIAHGAPSGSGDASAASLSAVVGRGTALTMLAAALGFSIATLGRNTAAALGAGFAYIIVFENVLGGFLEHWRRWLLLGNAIVFLSGENSGGSVPGRSVVGAALFLTAVTFTLLAGALIAFRARDLA